MSATSINAAIWDQGAESGLLGGILVHGNDVMAQVVELVEVEDFYDQRHRDIYLAMWLLWDKGQPVDEISVTSMLTDMGKLGPVGGAAYLAELADILLSPGHVEHYARLVRRKAKLRQISKAAQKIIAQAQGPDDPQEIIEQAQRTINQAAASAEGGGGVVHVAKAMDRTLEEFEERQAHHKDPNAIPTGFRAIDGLTGGMRPGKVWTIGARPSMGKTALALGIATHNALDLGNPVLYASSEEIEEDMCGRLICQRLRVSTTDWTQGRVAAGQANAIRQFRARIERAPLYWFCEGGFPIQALEAKARALHASSGLKLLVLDFIQQVAREESNTEITKVSKAMKKLAMNLRIPLIILSQLNRDLEKRENKRPIPPDLRASGSLEQDAHVILFLFRPAFYDLSADPNLCEVGVAKNKMGPKGLLRLSYTPEYTLFEDFGGSPSPQEEMF